MVSYDNFLNGKAQLSGKFGFKPDYMPDFLFDFQKSLVDWAVNKGKAAIFADCGLGKTVCELVWAQNIVRKTNKPVLLLAPLAVGPQMVEEGEKFGIEATRSTDGKFKSDKKIIVTSYGKLHYFNPSDFAGVIADESSILKNFDGATKSAVTEFMRLAKYRLLCTATAAPNDYTELGTSSEALGELGFMDMLGRFFKNTQNENKNVFNNSRGDEFRSGKYRLLGHAKHDFWRWVCSWARACRKPSDLGFDDGPFVLPELITREHVVQARTLKKGYIFDVPAYGLAEEREEKRRTINERCELVAELVGAHNKSAVCWCELNDEGDTLERIIPDAVQVAGKHSDERKIEMFQAFKNGEARVLVTKGKIAGFGLNWQHCGHETFFPTHSYEGWYQQIRRCWRFGRTEPVTVDMIATEGSHGILENLKRKDAQAAQMFANLVELMKRELNITQVDTMTNAVEVPQWLTPG